MSRSVLAAVVLASVAASAFPAPVAGYRLHLTETTNGAVVSADAAVDSTSISCPDVPVGVYQSSIVCIDAAGNELSSPVLGNVLPVTEVATVMVNVPESLVVSLA